MSRNEMVKTVASKGRAEKPTKKQRAAFAKVIGSPMFTPAERDTYLTWAARQATRKTMFELEEWLRLERFRREQANDKEAAA